MGKELALPTVEALRVKAKRSFDNNWVDWALASVFAKLIAPDQLAAIDSSSVRKALAPLPAPVWSQQLKLPAEKQLLDAIPQLQEWFEQWKQQGRVSDESGMKLDWRQAHWSRLGNQEIPDKVRFTDPAALAAFIGAGYVKRWALLVGRFRVLRDELGAQASVMALIGVAAAARANVAQLCALDKDEFDQVNQVVAWLRANDVAGLRPRQLPVRGVDSKWFSAREKLVTALVIAVTGNANLGVLRADARIRLRVLDASLLPLTMPTDITAPVAQLAELNLQPKLAFIFENLECVLAMPQWPGAVVLHGGGYAVNALGELPWLRDIPVWYWGDLDADGFAILSRARAHLPQLKSVLMDSATFSAFADLAVPDPNKTASELGHLTESERDTLTSLRDSGAKRLEQERIGWAYALAELHRVAD